jgi:chromosomal replication initiator protein
VTSPLRLVGGGDFCVDDESVTATGGQSSNPFVCANAAPCRAADKWGQNRMANEGMMAVSRREDADSENVPVRHDRGKHDMADQGGRGKSLGSIWTRVAARLRAELGEDLYSSWFARMEPESLADGVLNVSVPTRFLRSWIKSHYVDQLTACCAAEYDAVTLVEIQVRTRGLPTAAQALAPMTSVDDRGDEPAEPVAKSLRSSHPERERGSQLDHNLTFETYVQGQSNALAHAAAMRVAEARPGAPVTFNPLFIHSSAGLGKTHLINAIAWRIRDLNPDRKVLYITAERFMYHFMAALKVRDTLSFKDYFQSIDVLLIDDLQFLQGKSMQQEFCHTFNSLVDAKRQVVIAADVPPPQLESIDQRMRSRLAGGLVVDIEAPDLALRRNILQTKLSAVQRKDPSLMVAEEVLEFVANRITGGGRELEGALNRVIASQHLTRQPMTLDMAAFALRDLSSNNELVRIRVEDILRIVGRHFNVTRADLLSPRRARAVVRPRQIGMYLAKKLTSRSLPEIGRRFGNRDHSTVLHAVRKVEELMAADEKLAREVSLLSRLIEQG